MAKKDNQNVPETVVNEQSGTPAFPDPPDNRASRQPGPGLVRCVCTTKCYRDGLVRAGEVRYFKEVPEHFKAAEQFSAVDNPAE